ncbi:hypothetical protein HMPREF0083_04422 [Aneurinibacillus aneurinilyticus ATCC 12856]|uniref:Uncharacterized protein n=1 Tax=Aneurinibacillus aneurinilyticus ATCC 12856 TaxID=649747 RepID=U1WYX0_ANEAE|nr:hypothetical protein HMPREF0083_04422 [Aneurinibacillus aneurinilyticus ATCC 12856]
MGKKKQELVSILLMELPVLHSFFQPVFWAYFPLYMERFDI